VVNWGSGSGSTPTLVEVGADGGVIRELALVDAGAPTLAAMSASGALYLYDPAGPLTCVQEGVGGMGYVALGDHPGAAALSVVGNRLMPGGAQLVDADGGTVSSVLSSDGGELPLPRDTLSSGGFGYTFFSACRSPSQPSCADAGRATLVRAFNLQTGATYWEGTVLDGGVEGEIVEASALDAAPGGVLTLTNSRLDGAGRVDLQMIYGGQTAMLCPLEGSPTVVGAAFGPGRLFALVKSQDGWHLESFVLSPLPNSQSGWPTSDGRGGARRER
jgi:hypothetical protein